MELYSPDCRPGFGITSWWPDIHTITFIFLKLVFSCTDMTTATVNGGRRPSRRWRVEGLEIHPTGLSSWSGGYWGQLPKEEGSSTQTKGVPAERKWRGDKEHAVQAEVPVPALWLNKHKLREETQQTADSSIYSVIFSLRKISFHCSHTKKAWSVLCLLYCVIDLECETIKLNLTDPTPEQLTNVLSTHKPCGYDIQIVTDIDEYKRKTEERIVTQKQRGFPSWTKMFRS